MMSSPKGRKIRTTVVVTKAGEAILQKYRLNFGLKGPLSVGLLLFDRLTPEQREVMTRQVEEADRDPAELLTHFRDLALSIPAAALEALTPTAAEAIRRYRNVIASKPQQPQTKLSPRRTR
jgi:hypothetical protein